MIVLGMDGALGVFSAALARDGEIVAQECRPGNAALEAGLGAIAELLARASIEPPAIDRLAVGRGPGTFTGLRIALSYAKALAQAWERPLVPVGSFDVLEYGTAFDRVLTVVVGRPGVISARLRDGESIVRASGYVADVLDELGDALRRGETRENPIAVIGAPKDVLAALAERAVVVRPHCPAVTPAASAAALAAASRQAAPSVHAVVADYGELPAARVPRL